MQSFHHPSSIIGSGSGSRQQQAWGRHGGAGSSHAGGSRQGEQAGGSSQGGQAEGGRQGEAGSEEAGSEEQAGGVAGMVE